MASQTAARPTATAPPPAWSVLRVPTYRMLWTGGVVAGVGSVLQEITAGWLMTSLTTSPAPVALLQTAASLPVVLLALPAGAVADSIDRRRHMIRVQCFLAAVAVTLGVLALSGLMSPALLLAGVFTASLGGALFTPAWMRTVPDVLTGPQIPSGVILNSTAVNIARVLGASLAGLLLATLAPGSGFFVHAATALTFASVIAAWPGAQPLSRLPGERLLGAMRAGVRFVRHSPPHRAVYARTFLFVAGGSALPALLPVLARQELRLDALWFGLLTATFGGGALLGASVLNFLRGALSVEAIVSLMTMLLAAIAFLLSTVREPALVFPLLFLGGAAWVSMVALFGVSTGSASPAWVLSRALSLYMLFFQGGAALGGILWGQVAARAGVPAAFKGAAALLAVSVAARFFFRMPAANPHVLAASQHWPAPPAVPIDQQDRGPVLVTVEYHVDPARAADFEAVLRRASLERLRDGAYDWAVFVDPENAHRYLEVFRVESWLEHLRQHERVTHADMETERLARSFHIGPEPPRVTHYVARRHA